MLRRKHSLLLNHLPTLIMMSRPLIASALGILAHQLIFIRGEWHLLAPTVLSIHVIFALIVAGAEITFGSNENGGKFNALTSIVSYLISLFTSIAIYRLYFHRLRFFPGPRLAAVSKLWHVWQCRDSRNHLVLEQLREKYGAFVRTGEDAITS